MLHKHMIASKRLYPIRRSLAAASAGAIESVLDAAAKDPEIMKTQTR